jgi:hypothetical protein
VLVATGINADGHREVLGLQVATGETQAGWLAFFRDLVARGLTGVTLVTSDAHAGLVKAIAAIQPGASWQRCRTRYVADPATFSDLHGECVGGHVYGAGVEGRVRKSATCSSRSRAITLTWDFDSPVIHPVTAPAGPSAAWTPRSGSSRDHRGERGLGTPAPLEQPLREVRAMAQLGNRHVQRADAGVEVACR